MMSEKAALFSEEELSKLGFGCMRFIGREDNTIDIDYTCDMIDRYLAAGGNYFDTSWVYPNNEATLKKALVDRHPRESFFVATKCIAWAHCNGLEDLRKQLKESLDTLGVDYIDVYLMHNLGGNRTAAFDKNEREGIDAARDILTKAGTIPCTGCECCAKVCPNSIGISRAITALNYYIAFGDPYAANYQFGFVVRFNGGKALSSECVRCGACGEACPQGIDILDCFDRIEREIVPFSRKNVIMKS